MQELYGSMQIGQDKATTMQNLTSNDEAPPLAERSPATMRWRRHFGLANFAERARG